MELRNGRISLHLETLRAAHGPHLLLLHALGGSSADWRAVELPWRGSVQALDLSGHGRSGRVHGGDYWPELWAGDADAALAVLGQCVVVGAGVSAYVALLLAGARPALVRAAVLLPGAGLQGGGALPDWAAPWSETGPVTTPPTRELQAHPHADAPALLMGDRDLRPLEYAVQFATASRRLILVEDEQVRPSWWQAIRDAPNVSRTRDPLAPIVASLQDET